MEHKSRLVLKKKKKIHTHIMIPTFQAVINYYKAFWFSYTSAESGFPMHWLKSINATNSYILWIIYYLSIIQFLQ